MKKIYLITFLLVGVAACGDNDLGINPKNEGFPFRVVLDADEGGDLPDAEDYDVEIKFADYLGELPNDPITLQYEIKDVEGDMVGVVAIDKIVYEVELDDCVYERELEFTADGLTGTITVAADEDLGSVPESFEVVFVLPGLEDTEGGFVFELTALQTDDKILLGLPAAFEYTVLDHELAGEWELSLDTEEDFDNFKVVFGPLHEELAALTFADITGNVKVEFEFGEMKFELELAEEEEVTTCEDGVSETETVNKIIEIEADYDAEDGELELEGSHVIEGEELDFVITANYAVDGGAETIMLTFFKIIDEDNYEEGEELFMSDTGISFIFEKD
jgi:hypothetical protein